MDSFIQKLLDILAEKNYTPKYRDIPEDVENRDEIIADIQAILDDDGLLDDSLRYFELNGVTSALELATLLQKAFMQLKNEFFAAKHDANDALKHELLLQLDEIEKELEQEIQSARPLKDDTLMEMLETKALVCNEVKEFIQSQQVSQKTNISNKKQLERRSFKWLKGDDVLNSLFHQLISTELINSETDIDDFKQVFSQVEISCLNKPIHWEKGTKLFAYFINQLMEHKYIPRRPSWVLLPSCFTYYDDKKGAIVHMYEEVKSYVNEIKNEGAPKDFELVDNLFYIEGDTD